jgi:purine-cytosine permease-like protein
MATKSTDSAIEQHGLNVIPEADRHGKARQQFWPWAASNISLFGVSYAGFILSFGLSFVQALTAASIGIIFSFALVGFVALAGKRGSAPTMVLSRAIFGVRGNAIPTAVSYLLLVGWETVLVSLGVLVTSGILAAVGLTKADDPLVKIGAFVVIVAIVIVSGVFGFKFIMSIQKWITLASVVLTAVFVWLTIPSIDLKAVTMIPNNSNPAVLIAGIVFAATGFGLGWVNSGADYSRYLPRTTSGKSIFWWTTFGASIAPLILIAYGLLLATSNPKILAGIGGDPIGALTLALPESAKWFLLPYLLVVLLGFMGGAILDIYSSGLALLVLGLKLPRAAAASIDGVLMALGTAYFVFIANDFFWPFQAFLYLLGVPIAAWAGIFIADIAMRRKNYDEGALYSVWGRYHTVNFNAIFVLLLATVVGFGFVASPDRSITWTTWEGYLYNLLHITPDTSAWYYSNIGVLLAVVIGFVGHLLLGRRMVKRQENS